jgi:ubiquinone/menaquinone biosynthesis C-methylase UbiE
VTDTRRAHTVPARDTVVGNYHHKYSSKNPAIRWLTGRFLARLDALLDEIAAEVPTPRVLEIGCGEGEITKRLHERWGDVTAIDLPDEGLRGEWSAMKGPRFVHADAEWLPFPDDSFDIAVGIEVLEHLVDPDRGLRELARVSRGHLVVSVPREPLFRLGNLAALRHVENLGNTPGHLQHWSKADFVHFVGQVAPVRQVATPLPWTICWAMRF